MATSLIRLHDDFITEVLRLIEQLPPVHRVHRVDFFDSVITTTVTSDPEYVSAWIDTITDFLDRFDDPVVGLGVQWYPEPGYFPVAILTLSIGRRCLIIQLTRCSRRYVPETLRSFLLNRRYTFVGIWNHSDARRLWESEANLEFEDPPLDLRKYVEGGRLRGASFEAIVEECLGYSGVRLDTETSMSFWEDRDLSEEQVWHATVKAHASFLIGMKYRAWEFKVSVIRIWGEENSTIDSGADFAG